MGLVPGASLASNCVYVSTIKTSIHFHALVTEAGLANLPFLALAKGPPIVGSPISLPGQFTCCCTMPGSAPLSTWLLSVCQEQQEAQGTRLQSSGGQ